jgi:hypothetical protein
MLISGTAPLPTIEEEVENPFGPAAVSRYDYGLIYGETFMKRNGLSATSLYLLEPTHLSSFGKVNGIAEDLTWEIFRHLN